MSYETYAMLRDAAGLTDYQVAKLAGISRPTLSDWKNGRYTPKDDKRRKIAEVLGVSIDALDGDVHSNVHSEGYYIDEENTNEEKLRRMENFHLLGQNLVRRCKHVFLVNGKYTEARKQCEREFIKFLEEQGEKVYDEEKKDCNYE